jgi:kynurenine formamidase
MRRCVAILFVLTACATAQPHSLDLASAGVVDLTYAFDSTTLYWPTSPTAFKLTELSRGPTPGGWFYSANTFSAPEHGGTHLDAPIHFFEKGLTVDRIPVRQLVAPAIVIDVTSQSAADADYRLSLADVHAWETTHGGIPTGTIVLLRTGWGKKYGNRKAYFGDDTPGATDKLHFPSFGADAVRFLINDRHIGAIGVDTPSIDYGQSKDFIVHQVASAAGVPGLENVAKLEIVPTRGAWVVALPMKIGGGSGAPLRIVALVHR